jgi:hypothetical protein
MKFLAIYLAFGCFLTYMNSVTHEKSCAKPMKMTTIMQGVLVLPLLSPFSLFITDEKPRECGAI